MNFKRIAIFAVLMFAVAAARADQTYSGSISGDITWTSGEVISITGTSEITGNVVAEPGVQVRLSAGVQLVMVGGTLTANGMAAQPVSFGPAAGPNPSYWHQLQVVNGGTITLNYATITHARAAVFGSNSAINLHHCTITDIAEADGVDAVDGQNGTNGNSVIAVGAVSGTDVNITDTVIDGVRGGNGGDGGDGTFDFQNGNGGTAGGGGGVTGFLRFGSEPSTLIFERNVLGNISGGSGGTGGDAVGGGNGGDGGNSGTVNGMQLDGAATGTLSNCVLHHVNSGAAGDGGIADPDGGGSTFPGNPGSRGNCTGILNVSSVLELRHFTIDALGDPLVGITDAVDSFSSGSPGSIRLLNSTLTNIQGITARGIFAPSPPTTAEALTCNFFNTPGVVNVGTVTSPVSFDPGFVNAAAGDYHLSAGSSLIGIGQSTTTTDDLDGQTRDAAPDIGADEYASAYNGRPLGDFDNSHCTDVIDFLFLLDNWQVEVEGQVIGITDFLGLLDNWQLGSSC